MSNIGDVLVRVMSEFMPESSQQERYVFIYHISIQNRGSLAVKLLRRHWYIVDANEQTEEVTGDGVVGEKPTIAPGEVYEYSSFCVLETPVGCMYGQYFMQAEDGCEFNVDIPVFTLADSRVLQ